MTLKDRIKQLALDRGISLPALEAELGFGNSTIVKWDKSTPNAEKLNAVAKYFDVSMDYLLNGKTSTTDIESFAKDETERELLMLCRNATKANPEDKEALVENFKSTIDIYLKAKGLK